MDIFQYSYNMVETVTLGFMLYAFVRQKAFKKDWIGLFIFLFFEKVGFSCNVCLSLIALEC